MGKERVEQYAAKKEAVSALTEHVAIRQVLQQNKLDVVNEELDQEDDNSANAARLGLVKTGLKEHTERMQILQRNMAKNAETMSKREQLKEMLEKQVLLEEKMTEGEVKQMVENVEGKCKTVKSDMANIAMTEQYLRTKQALLMAKKKEQEMKVAANIAAIREQEVQKMRDKVKCMQDLLASRKQKLKITEEILVEKGDQKKHLDKDVEKMKRRESYVEKELVERKIFEKEPPKKK